MKVLNKTTRKNRRTIILFFLFIVYIFSTKTTIESGNSASRYATIESLVEKGTFIIDDSAFIDTNDKIYINNHFYSDKPPILSFLTSGIYLVLYYVFGISFKNNLALVTYIITLLTSGLTTILMLFFFYKSLEFLKVEEKYQHILVLTLGLATLIFPYTLVFNNHIIVANLSFIIFYFIIKNKFEILKEYEYYLIGLLAGLIFAIDLVTGGTFLVLFSLYFLINLFKKSIIKLAYYIVGIIIPIFLYLYFNILIGGTILPFSLVPEFFDYPGSDFTKDNLTGVASHDSLSSLLIYSFHVLFGYRGLFSYSPILLISFYFLIKLSANKKYLFFKEALLVLIGMSTVVLFYIFKSNNYGGYAYGMRWFVAFTPLLFFFTVFYFKDKLTSKKLKFCLLLVLISFFVALVGVYNPWADSFGYPFFLNQPVPFLNNLRFLLEDLLKFIDPSLLEYIKGLI